MQKKSPDLIYILSAVRNGRGCISDPGTLYVKLFFGGFHFLLGVVHGDIRTLYDIIDTGITLLVY